MTLLVTLTRHARVGVITLDNPPVNALSHALRVTLLEHLMAAAADPELDAVVIACAGRTFVAGADIREFGKPPLEPDLPDVVEFLDTIDKPLIAALHGTALGGGLELALACHYRVAASSARVGLPEVTLGILPGAGGTQRLPRLVGVRVALDLIVRGTIIPATKARALGLVDELVSGDLVERAVAFAESVVAERRPLRRTSALAVSLNDPGVFEEYEQLAARQWRGFLAPLRCIAAVRATTELPFQHGLRKERELFAELMGSAQSRAQRHLFFGEREVARPPGLSEETRARPVRSVGVVGSGSLAAEIAECFAGARLPVAVLGPTAAETEDCFMEIRRSSAELVTRGAIKQEEANDRLALIRQAHSYQEFADADLVIEAMPEEPNAKRDAFTRLDAACKAGAVLATTSSWLALDEIASSTRRPEDVIVMHFAVPAARVIETARGPRSAPEACATAMKVVRSLGKVSVLVAASAGLVGDRLRARSALEALRLLDEGASVEQLDRVLYEFGIPTGWDSALEHDPSHDSQSSGSHGVLAEIEWLGSIARAATWQGPDAGALDATIGRMRERSYYDGDAAQRLVSDREVLERCVFSVINEAARILDEKLVARPLEIDIIAVHGLGFPAYRGGPLFHADELGVTAVAEAARRYCAEVDAATWTPAALLHRLATVGGRFYDSAGAEPR